MFIGHYGASFAAKAAAPRTPLAALFVAVQALDVLFFSLVLAGVEKVRIVPGYTEYNAYDLYFMPYSHSLAGAVAWSIALGAAWWAVTRQRAAAIAIGLAVASHFALDFPVHTADLPLLGEGSPKLGLGLWNFRWATVALELAVLFGGFFLLARRDRRWARVRGARILVGVMAVVAVATPFLPAPHGPVDFAIQGLLGYALLAVGARFTERAVERAA